MEIGEKILKAIRRKGITQKKLAEFLGVSSPSVARWITNESYPMVDKFIKMVEYLDMVEDFFPEYTKKEEQVVTVQYERDKELAKRIDQVEKKDREIIDRINKLEELMRKPVPKDLFDNLKLGEN